MPENEVKHSELVYIGFVDILLFSGSMLLMFKSTSKLGKFAVCGMSIGRLKKREHNESVTIS